jgi:hypothetical protein
MIPVKTYRDLKRMLDSMTEAQLDCDITQYDGGVDEFFAAELFIAFAEDTNVLDNGHPYFENGFYQIAPMYND